jgi:WD repeat-containing protein 48
MRWINDMCLVQNNSGLVTGSSDFTVKVWRPHSAEQSEAKTIGEHTDFVKCIATPPEDRSASWVASGSLDHKIYVWDLNGGGKTLEIDTSGEEVKEKGSVYSLAVRHNMVAAGGPEKILRLWDAKSGKRITKFVGHTDNIRSILLNAAGDTVLTASTDRTIKLWSITAGRCMYTFTMHDESVWSLYSEDPDLGVFYSSDRAGLVVKTDVRGTLLEQLDDGLSVAVAQETDGVSKIVACGDYIWTATAKSSINRWASVDTSADIQLPETHRHHRSASSATNRPRESSISVNGTGKKGIPAKSILRISNTASYPPRDPETTTLGTTTTRKGSEILLDNQINPVEPIHELPEETIEGQFGLVKHKLLNDRRRALTLDTAGDVLLWDLVKVETLTWQLHIVD